MELENYKDIWYLDHPHFVDGYADQWGEQGFLLYEGQVYKYEEDRKDQNGRVFSPMSIADFLAYAARQVIEVPEEFMAELRKVVA